MRRMMSERGDNKNELKESPLDRAHAISSEVEEKIKNKLERMTMPTERHEKGDAD